jgi:hypothetical protein
VRVLKTYLSQHAHKKRSSNKYKMVANFSSNLSFQNYFLHFKGYDRVIWIDVNFFYEHVAINTFLIRAPLLVLILIQSESKKHSKKEKLATILYLFDDHL